MKVKCPTCNCYVDLMFDTMEDWFLSGKKVMCTKCRHSFDISEVEKKEELKNLLTEARKELNKIDKIRKEIEYEEQAVIIINNKSYKLKIIVEEVEE